MSENEPEGYAPRAESYAGSVMPGGRGMEQHGVDFVGAPDLVDEAELGDPVVYEEPTTEPAPIPVRVVHDVDRERRAFRTYRHVASKTGGPSQVVGQNENRTKLKVRNVGPELVYVSSEQHTANSVFGYPLAMGAEFETTGEGPLWASVDSAAATDTSSLAVFHEYSTGIQ